jgi:DNA polymerase III sliding clamp (beta) subunit (PCNA family)
VLEAVVDITLNAECYVDAHTFLNVLGSLPDGATLEMELDNGVLLWAAGNAKGKLGTVDVSDMLTLPKFKPDAAYKVSNEFIRALKCGTLSCTSPALASVGMYGITLDNKDFPSVLSSDNTTASFCPFGEEPAYGFPDTCCLPPLGVELLSGIMSTGGTIAFKDDALFYTDKSYDYMLTTIPPLKHDIRGIIDQFSEMNNVVPIPPDRVKAFVKRATALAESKKNTIVTMGAEDGNLVISFEEGASQADEYYLVDGVKLPDMPFVKLNADALARALEQAEELVIDYMGKGVVVLVNTKTMFIYVISGRK